MMPLFLYRIFQSGRNSLAYILYAILATVVVTGIVAISAVMLPGFIDHLVDMDKGSSSARVEMLTRGMSAIIDKPLLGYGHGMSVYLAGMVGSDGHLTIDNYFLSMALDEGMPSLIIYFSIFVTALLFAFKMPKYLSTETPSMIYLAPAIFVFLIIQSIASLGSNQNLAITLCFIIVRGYSMRSFPSKNGPNQK
jgi:O-antigen ligase